MEECEGALTAVRMLPVNNRSILYRCFSVDLGHSPVRPDSDLLPNVLMELKPRAFLTSALATLQYSQPGPPCKADNNYITPSTLKGIIAYNHTERGSEFHITQAGQNMVTQYDNIVKMVTNIVVETQHNGRYMTALYNYYYYTVLVF